MSLVVEVRSGQANKLHHLDKKQCLYHRPNVYLDTNSIFLIGIYFYTHYLALFDK